MSAHFTEVAFEENRLLSVNATAAMLSLGRTSIYSMLRDGRLKGVRLGGRTLVQHGSIEALITTAPAFSPNRVSN